MAIQTLSCEKCHKPSEVDVPDDGSATVWECTDFECSHHNKVGTPADPAAPPATPEPGVVVVADGDTGKAKSRHK